MNDKEKENDHLRPIPLNLICDNRISNDHSDNQQELSIVFDGSHTLWRTGTHMDVLIVFHEPLDCFEVVVFSPHMNEEAPRVYLQASQIFSKCKLETLNNLRELINDENIRERKLLDRKNLEKEIYRKFAGDYIVSRIALPDVDTPDSDETTSAKPTFKIILRPKFSDFIPESSISHNDMLELDSIINKPDELVPIKTMHRTSVSSEQINSCIDAILRECVLLTNDGKKAAKLSSLTHVAMTTFLNVNFKAFKGDKKNPSYRWRRAINRILSRNFCSKVRVRLGLTPLDPFPDILCEEEIEVKRPNFMRNTGTGLDLYQLAMLSPSDVESRILSSRANSNPNLLLSLSSPELSNGAGQRSSNCYLHGALLQGFRLPSISRPNSPSCSASVTSKSGSRASSRSSSRVNSRPTSALQDNGTHYVYGKHSSTLPTLISRCATMDAL